jgi:Recombination endonuclease VII
MDRPWVNLLDIAFNLTPEGWYRILDYQGGKCFICLKRIDLFKTTDKPRPHTDHDHKSGLVRGLLCSQCNRALGKVMDPRWQWNPESLRRAAMYLERPPAPEALKQYVYGYPGRIGTKKYLKWAAKKKQMKLFEK